jgi:hypothetical protein
MPPSERHIHTRLKANNARDGLPGPANSARLRAVSPTVSEAVCRGTHPSPSRPSATATEKAVAGKQTRSMGTEAVTSGFAVVAARKRTRLRFQVYPYNYDTVTRTYTRGIKPLSRLRRLGGESSGKLVTDLQAERCTSVPSEARFHKIITNTWRDHSDD